MPRPVALVTGSGKRRVGRSRRRRPGRPRLRPGLALPQSAGGRQRGPRRDYGPRRREAVAVQADLTDESAIQALVAKTLNHFGRDRRAGERRRRLGPQDAGGRDRRRRAASFETNTLGTFLCCQHAGLAMVKQPEGGNIVTIGDWAIERPYLELRRLFPVQGRDPDVDAHVWPWNWARAIRTCA